MNQIFIEALNKDFFGQFKVDSEAEESHIIFPAKSPEFGDVEIYEECPGSYILCMGELSHDIINHLHLIFADQIVIFGGEWGGGSGQKEYFLGEKHQYEDLYVWSGLYRKGMPRPDDCSTTESNDV